MSKELDALETIKNISLSHFSYDSDENLDGEWEYTPVDVDDGTIEENYPEEIKIIEDALIAREVQKQTINLLKEENRHWGDKAKYLQDIFQIIKRKGVNVSRLSVAHYVEMYNFALMSDRWLTQEEFDLLKEELL